LNINEEITLRCEKVAHGGFVVGRHEGVVIFVRLALPNELVRARLLKAAPGKKAWFAEAIEILESSPHRVEPICKYFGPQGCGGCDFQHVDIDYQLLLKEEILTEQMIRLAKIDVKDLIKCYQLNPKDYGWRSKIRLSPNSVGKLGYRKFRSHEIIAIDKCPIAVDEINSKLESDLDLVFEFEQELISTSEGVLDLSARQDHKVTSVIHGVSFVHMASGFWQSHKQAAAKLSELVLENIESHESALDLYAGVGIFGRLLLEQKKTKHLTSVELDRVANSCARENLANFSQAKAINSSVEKFLSTNKKEFDLVLLDPPRKGIGERDAMKIAQLAKQKIVYVSCDPASLARDTRVLTQAGWRLSHLDLVDAFPQTHHLETVAVFVPQL
jgi:tRNA/tmRNA/rRNA uracil-C5-methylase (TrmA/RlmC/RlmD family)